MADEVDAIDIILAAVYGLTAAASIGVVGVELFDVELLEVIEEAGPITLDYATVLSAGVWVVAIARAQPDIEGLSQQSRWMIAGAILLVAYGAFEPAGVVDRAGEAVGLIALAVAGAGYWVTVTSPDR